MRHFLPVIILLLWFQSAFSQQMVDAHPVGGKNQLNYFIEQELIYPSLMLDRGIEGKVSFLFDVDETGHVSNLRNILSPHESAFAETSRIFYLLEWVPAHSGGIPVKDTEEFEIDFNLKKYKRLCRQRGYTHIVNPYEPVDSGRKVYWYRSLDTAPSPIFTDKNENLATFIAKNLQYPELALRSNVTGVVKLSFIIETNGRVSNISIQNPVGAGCNEEAIRILRLIKWMPGIFENMAVRTRTSLSISFNLDRGKDGMFNPVIKSSYGG